MDLADANSNHYYLLDSIHRKILGTPLPAVVLQAVYWQLEQVPVQS